MKLMSFLLFYWKILKKTFSLQITGYHYDNDSKKNKGILYRDYLYEVEEKKYLVDKNNDISYSIIKEKTEQPYTKPIEKTLKFKVIF